MGQVYLFGMIVTTHFEPTGVLPPSDYMRLLELWRVSWERQGFTCIVTGRDFIDSKMNCEGVRKFCEKVDGFPSVNGGGFDRASFRRWLAAFLLAGEVGELCVSEGDVINYGFGKKDVLGLSGWDFNIGDTDGCPAFVFCGLNVLNKLVQSIVNHELQPEDSYHGRPHLSDQDFIARYTAKEDWYHSLPDVVKSVFSSGWQEGKLVHYGTPFFISNNVETKHTAKVDLIQQLKAL